MREEMEKVRERWTQMPEEEKQKVEAKFHEKYGFFPSSTGTAAGDSVGSGRRHSRQDNGQ